MRHSIITALGVCLVASFTACGNKQTKDAEAVDSTAIKDTIVSEKVEPQVDSTKIFSDTVAQRGKMVYKVTRQVEDDIVYDDERDLDKSTATESLRLTFKSNGKVSIKETLQDDATWSGEWEANGYDITVYANDLLTSSLRTPKFFIKEFSDFLMPCHQHGLRINLLVQR